MTLRYWTAGESHGKALLALVDAITPRQVADVAREFFDPERMTVVSLGPQPVAG